ncbi:N-acetyltransferase [Methanolapillus ohkumae]|uniref:N-acetyltransferase domain-containing protein n=1 Tax=Methanolapillus ohkumae TaxID=3028298 RepID=A0AA96VE85_9EURY|nr:hypothetical protein MsAm2_04580 [Methanosarcinaceae archaeon Am2]
MIQIRLEKKEDERIVEELTREAFWNVYVPGCTEPFLLHQMRKSPDFIPELDFVAVCNSKIVGNIVYTRSKIVNESGQEFPTLTFGPVSVLPDFQKQGIGTALIEYSKREAKRQKFSAIIIYGNPDYYSKFGFKAASAFGISRADGKFPKAMLALELQDGALSGISGCFFESAAFDIDPTDAEKFDLNFSPKEKRRTDSQKEFEILANLFE